MGDIMELEIVLDEKEEECSTIKEEKREYQTYYRGRRYERKSKEDKAKRMFDKGRSEIANRILFELIDKGKQ